MQQDRPLLNVVIQIGLGVAVIMLQLGYGGIVERREVTQLSTPGLAREWAWGALFGAGLFTDCTVILLLIAIRRAHMRPAMWNR